MRIKILAAMAALAIAASSVIAISPAQARWHGGWHGGGYGWGPALGGFAAGAIIGGALAGRPYYYGPGYYYDYAPGYAYAPGGAVAYCMQRFKSYDPASGTYLGYDGYRHPCP
jgi:BA14K-like protein